MAIDYSKFDKAMDLEGLSKDIREAEENGGGDYREVPHGTYEVKVAKLELTESKKGDPMVSAWFTVLAGEYKGSYIFMNQVVNKGFQVHIVNDFLRSLNSNVDIEWPGNYAAFAQMLLDVHESIDGNLEYALEYGEKKGFNTFKITEVFEAESE